MKSISIMAIRDSFGRKTKVAQSGGALDMAQHGLPFLAHYTRRRNLTGMCMQEPNAYDAGYCIDRPDPDEPDKEWESSRLERLVLYWREVRKNRRVTRHMWGRSATR